MPRLLKKLALTSITIGFLAVHGFSQAATNPTSTTAPVATSLAQQPLSLLFVIEADSGKIVQVGSGYQLILTGINPKTLWFTDRPGRKAGFIHTTSFIANWPQAFKTSQPNVAIVHAAMDAEEGKAAQAEAMELANPVYDGKTLTFSIDKLNGDKFSVGQYTKVKVFVDDASAVEIDEGGPMAGFGTGLG